MRTRTFIVAALCGLTILGWTVGRGSGAAVAARECPTDVGAADRDAGVGAVQEGHVVGLATGSAPVAAGSRTATRHVTTSAAGTAYVEDRPGADAVVLATARGTHVLRQSGEAYHPTWSVAGAI